LEVLRKNPYVVIDGAHNISGIEFLKSNIEEYFKYKNIYLILGILADKNVDEMVKIIAPLATEVYTVTANSIRAKNANELKDVVLKYNENCIAFNEYNKAIELALSKAKKDDLIIASGSLYMIGEIRRILNNI
ncbi:glutamate ligase domain-containing protein, partial [Clostridium perfringens]|uniref:glutamate ligase domain-containing protein n=2 Tax=Clostridium TaxID=1485 RepID=UPI002AC40FE4